MYVQIQYIPKRGWFYCRMLIYVGLDGSSAGAQGSQVSAAVWRAAGFGGCAFGVTRRLWRKNCCWCHKKWVISRRSYLQVTLQYRRKFRHLLGTGVKSTQFVLNRLGLVCPCCFAFVRASFSTSIIFKS